jgi:hypothetical protein
MTARKINCSAKCSLDSTQRATLRGVLEDSEDSSASRQYSEDLSTRQIMRHCRQTNRIPEEKGLLRRIQKPEYRTEKITSLV